VKDKTLIILGICGVLCFTFLVIIGADVKVIADNISYGTIQGYCDNDAYCDYGDCTSEALKKLTTYQYTKRLSFLRDNNYYQIAVKSDRYTTTNSNVIFETKKVYKYDDNLGGFVMERVRVPSGIRTETESFNATTYILGGNYCVEHLDTVEAKIKNDVIVATIQSYWYFLLFIVLYILALTGLIVFKRKAKRKTA
jgi:hypothetical protein